MNVGKEIAVLKHMPATELRAKYAEVFGEDTRSRHKDDLVKRITWRLQSLAEGDLSERARARAAELWRTAHCFGEEWLGTADASVFRWL